MSICPCRILDQYKLTYEECCLPFIEGEKSPQTAELLMRSRYSAYVVKNINYIANTQVTIKDEVFDKEEALKWAESSDWLGLEIIKTQKGGKEDHTGVVEFVANYKYKQTGAELKHHETSFFTKENNVWKFMEGQIHGGGPIKRVAPKIGRSDPCSCGSGKKYKKCCGA